MIKKGMRLGRCGKRVGASFNGDRSRRADFHLQDLLGAMSLSFSSNSSTIHSMQICIVFNPKNDIEKGFACDYLATAPGPGVICTARRKYIATLSGEGTVTEEMSCTW